MKTMLFLCFAILCLSFSITEPVAKTSLIDAINKKWVTVNALSNGDNSGNCVQMQVKNISGNDLSLSLPAGSVMNTTNEGEQDILVTRPVEVVVRNAASTTNDVYGFCCQASNSVPQTGSSFKVENCSNEKLRKMAEYLSTKSYDPSLEQFAIWAVSDNHSVGGIYGHNQVQCQELREFTSTLLGIPVPFYDVDYGYVANTDFVYAPKSLRGNMNYRILVSGMASLFIYNPDGEIFETFFENRKMESGFYRQKFSYTAIDMAAGEYKVKLIIDGNVICENSITL